MSAQKTERFFGDKKETAAWWKGASADGKSNVKQADINVPRSYWYLRMNKEEPDSLLFGLCHRTIQKRSNKLKNHEEERRIVEWVTLKDSAGRPYHQV